MATKTRTSGRVEGGFIYDIVLDVSEKVGDKLEKIAQVTDHWNLNPNATKAEFLEAIQAILAGGFLGDEMKEIIRKFAVRYNYGHDVKARDEEKRGTRAKTGVRAQLKEAETKKQELIAEARKRKANGDPGLYDSLVQLDWIKE